MSWCCSWLLDSVGENSFFKVKQVTVEVNEGWVRKMWIEPHYSRAHATLPCEIIKCFFFQLKGKDSKGEFLKPASYYRGHFENRFLAEIQICVSVRRQCVKWRQVDPLWQPLLVYRISVTLERRLFLLQGLRLNK